MNVETKALLAAMKEPGYPLSDQGRKAAAELIESQAETIERQARNIGSMSILCNAQLKEIDALKAAPQVPDGWRELIHKCSQYAYAGGMINGNGLSRKAAPLLAAAPLPAVVPMSIPVDVQQALDRMCTPLHGSFLAGATAIADAKCMAIIRSFIESLPAVAPTQPCNLEHATCSLSSTPGNAILDALHMAKHIVNDHGTREQAEQIFNAIEQLGGEAMNDKTPGNASDVAILAAVDKIAPHGQLVMLKQFGGALNEWVLTDDARTLARALFAAPVVAQDDAGEMAYESMRHQANEWADMATNGIQWIRNIKDGFSTPDEALADMFANIEHCRAVTQKTMKPATPVVTQSLKAAPDLAGERDRFEAWGNATFNYGFKPDSYIPNNDVDYSHEETQMAWEGWQAALASRPQVSAPKEKP